MKGWHTQVAGEYERPTGVIGVVVAPKFPDLDLIREKIAEGAQRVAPETVWVVREKRQRGHAVNAVWDVLEEHGIEPLLVPLVPAWRHRSAKYRAHQAARGRLVFWERMADPEYDLRRRWADAELGNTCERVIVFHDKSSDVTKKWAEEKECSAKVFVIERGIKRAALAKRGRKPVE